MPLQESKGNTFSVVVLHTSEAQHHAVGKLNTFASYSPINSITLKKKNLFQTSFYFNISLLFTFSCNYFNHYAVMSPLDTTLSETVTRLGALSYNVNIKQL